MVIHKLFSQAQGYVTVDEVERRLSWTSGRAVDALDTLLDVSFSSYLFSHIQHSQTLGLYKHSALLQEGLAMIDDGHRDGRRRYWFPCVSPISSSFTTDA